MPSPASPLPRGAARCVRTTRVGRPPRRAVAAPALGRPRPRPLPPGRARGAAADPAHTRRVVHGPAPAGLERPGPALGAATARAHSSSRRHRDVGVRGSDGRDDGPEHPRATTAPNIPEQCPRRHEAALWFGPGGPRSWAAPRSWARRHAYTKARRHRGARRSGHASGGPGKGSGSPCPSRRESPRAGQGFSEEYRRATSAAVRARSTAWTSSTAPFQKSTSAPS